MTHNLTKSSWLISGIVLIFAGIIALISPESVIVTIAYILGIALLISGIGNIIVYFVLRYNFSGVKWFLADGLITILLALFLFFNHLATAVVIPYIFCMWIIFGGVTKAIAAFEMRSAEMQGWWWMALIGAIGIIIGIVTLFNPMIATWAIGISLGLFLILQGILSIAQWRFSIHRL